MPLDRCRFPICAVRLSVAMWLAAIVFSFAPQIDVATSRLFFDPVVGFWMAKDTGLLAVREAIWGGCLIALIGAAAAWAYSWRRSPVMGIPVRVWGFVVMLHLLGPGVLANLLLKSYWGRARPASVLEFGGSQQFTPALEPAEQCVRNCSFVSGEGSMVAAMLISGLVLTQYLTSPKWSRIVTVGLWSIALVGMGLRVMMGRHFLSDTIFAGLFVSVIALLLRRIFAPRADAPTVAPTAPPRADP